MFSCNNKHRKKSHIASWRPNITDGSRYRLLPNTILKYPNLDGNPDAGAPRPSPTPGTPEIYDHAGASAQPAARTSSAHAQPTRTNLITVETVGGGGGVSGVWGVGGGGAVRGAEVRLKGTEPRLDSGSINRISEAPTHT